MSKSKVLIIASEGLTSNLLFESLNQNFEVQKVLIEEKETKKAFVKRRIKHCGFFRTMGQLAFLSLISPLINGKKRTEEIIKRHKLKAPIIPFSEIEKIGNVNNSKTIALIQKIRPDFIFINGTRIIKKSTLGQINVPVLNIHTGITPKYRGVHGGYWANYHNNLDLFGTTLHLVDAGVDSGKILAQKVLTPDRKDNYKSYPILQYCEGLDLVKSQLENIKSGDFKSSEALTKESQLLYHPRACQYIFKRIFKGVK